MKGHSNKLGRSGFEIRITDNQDIVQTELLQTASHSWNVNQTTCLCLLYRRPFPDVSRVQPAIVIYRLLGFLWILEISHEHTGTSDTHLCKTCF